VQEIELTCSNRPRPSVHSNATSHGNQHWSRDVFHAAGTKGKTLCGTSADGWIAMGTVTAASITANHHLCHRCRAKLLRA